MGLSGAPAAGPLAPGQRWSVARKRTQRRCIVVGTEGKRLTRGEAPLLARLNQIPPASEPPLVRLAQKDLVLAKGSLSDDQSKASGSSTLSEAFMVSASRLAAAR